MARYLLPFKGRQLRYIHLHDFFFISLTLSWRTLESVMQFCDANLLQRHLHPKIHKKNYVKHIRYITFDP